MIAEPASLLRIYVNGSQRWQGRPLYQAVVETARELHLAGASVFLVDLAYGTHRQLHDAKNEYSFVDIPVVIEIVDGTSRIEELLNRLDPMLADGFATVEGVRVVLYAHHEDRPQAGIEEEKPGQWKDRRNG